jgi:hypothetical protein
VVLELVSTVIIGDRVSTSETEPLEVFLYALRSKTTRSRYLKRPKNFFDHLEIEGAGTSEKRRRINRERVQDGLIMEEINYWWPAATNFGFYVQSLVLN